MLLRSFVVITVAHLVSRKLAKKKIVFTHSDSPLRRGMVVTLALHIVARVGHGTVDDAAWSSRAWLYSPFGMLIVL